MEESTEILTIFPWYSYVVGIFIFALGVIAIRRQPGEKKSWGKIEILCLVFSVAVAFVAPIQNIPWDGKLRLTNIGYPVFRFVKTSLSIIKRFSTSRRAWLSFPI